MIRWAKLRDFWLTVPSALGLVSAVVVWAVIPNIALRVSGSAWLWVVGGAGALASIVGLWWWHLLWGRRHQHLAAIAQLEAVSTAHRQAHEAADADRARLLLRLDHELKNPLTALRISLSTAEAQDPETLTSALQTASNQTERLATLVEDLRKVSEVRSRPLDIEMVDIGELLEDVQEVVQDAHPEASALREWSIVVPTAPWPLPKVAADPGLLFLAIHNLVENAIKYSRPHDRVELRGLEDAEGNVLIEVADTGMGIPSEEHSLVWEELARSASIARSLPGSGLGLPLVSTIVSRHGGKVELRSRPEAGTLVRIVLPGVSASLH